MITREYVRAMAVYNRWQNQNLYGTAEALSDEVTKPSAALSSAPSTARSTISCGVTRSG